MAKAKQMPADARDLIRGVMERHTDAFIQTMCKWQHMGDEHTPSGKAVIAKYNWDQQTIMRIRRMHERRGVAFRGLLGKARQRGISTSNVYRAHVKCAAVDGRKTVFVAHREDRAIAFQDKVRFMRNQWPEWFRAMFPLKHDNDFKMSFHWDSVQWIMSVYNAQAVDLARGDTPHEVLGTEWTRWPNFVNTLTEIMSSCHFSANTAGMLESTLKGRGSEQYQFWLDTKAGKTPWSAHWLGWQNDPASHNDCHLWSEAEQHRRMAEVAEYEPELLRRGLRYDLSVGQVWQSYLWLRNTKLGKWEKFIEDYPLDDDEAWQALGYLYFNDDELIKIGDQLKDVPKIVFRLTLHELERGFAKFKNLAENSEAVDAGDPHIVVFAPCRPGDEYVIGAWPESGNQHASPSSAHVINKITGQMMAAVHGKVKPHQLGQILNAVGRIYNDAVIAPEARTSEGISCIAELIRLNYPRLYRWKAFDDLDLKDKSKTGWWTNRQTSTLTLNLLARVLEQAAIGGTEIHRKLILDTGVIHEMGTFIEDQETGLPGPQANCHDTRIVSLAIAWYVADMETRGWDRSALNSLRPCQILSSDMTMKERPEVSSVIIQARGFINEMIGSFRNEQESEWWG